MNHTLKVTSTLSDETRFSIYQYMLQEKRPFTVQEIAERFEIHPNVARLHLTKLSEINIITSEFEKTGKGGRPGRIYKATMSGITLSFPQRNSEELFNWLLQLLEELGEEALVVGRKISYKDGYEQIDKLLKDRQKRNEEFTFDERIQILTEAATSFGYIPNIKDTKEGRLLSFEVYNCPYYDQAQKYANLICDLHESFLKGQFDALFDVKEFVQFGSMVHQCKNCTYHVLL